MNKAGKQLKFACLRDILNNELMSDSIFLSRQMNAENFLLSIIASIIANLIFYVPILIIGLSLWKRHHVVLKMWSVSFPARTGNHYTLIMSTHTDELGRHHPAVTEQEAILDIRDFFKNFWLGIVSHVTMLKPVLSQANADDLSSDSHLVLIGGPGTNQYTQQHLTRLSDYNLPYSFILKGNSWIIWNPIRGQEFVPEPQVRSFQSEPNYTDYGLFIRAPQSKRNRVVMIFAGLHSAGTRAATQVAMSPSLCREVYSRLNQQHIKSDYFVVLVRITSQNFVRQDPEILDVKPIDANPTNILMRKVASDNGVEAITD